MREAKAPYRWPDNWPSGSTGPGKDIMLRVSGKRFRCGCGCNVFQHPPTEPDIYRCNACGIEYEEAA